MVRLIIEESTTTTHQANFVRDLIFPLKYIIHSDKISVFLFFFVAFCAIVMIETILV